MVEVPIMCEYLTEENLDCTNAATWIVHIAHHCQAGTDKHVMFCEPCLGALKSGDEWRCEDCDSYARAIDYVLSITRI